MVSPSFADKLDRQRALAWEAEVGGPILVAVSVTADDDGLRPTGHQAGHVAADDGLAEDDAAEDVADGAVGALPHLLQIELFDARLVRRDGRALDADAVLLDGVGRVDGDLVARRVAVFDRKVVVFEVHIQIRMDQLVLDQLPDDAGHLVAVELDDGSGHLDLLHLGLKKGGATSLPRNHIRGVAMQQESKGAAVNPIVSVGMDAEGHRVPCVFASDTPVAEVVRVCQERTIDVGLTELAVAGLDRTSLEPLLVYCAEERCVADLATCPGCSKRQEAEGVTSFDRFAARFREIVIGGGEVRIAGNGTEELQVDSLEVLAATWPGEHYWFWARRVLRKLRHGIRRSGLHGVRLRCRGRDAGGVADGAAAADNIGMVARAMANFGLDDLRLVAPRDGWPNEKARIAASGANYIVDAAADFPTLEGGDRRLQLAGRHHGAPARPRASRS